MLSKIEDLGKTANDAVLNSGSHSSEDGDENTSDEDESDDETECLYENEQLQQLQSVDTLLRIVHRRKLLFASSSGFYCSWLGYNPYNLYIKTNNFRRSKFTMIFGNSD